MLAEFELGTAERGIDIDARRRGGPVWALGDPGSVARILRILLDNAVRVSPEGREITVELRNGGDDVALSVCDQGPGVPPEERELIFERFKRGRETGGQARLRARARDRARAGRADGRRAGARRHDVRRREVHAHGCPPPRRPTKTRSRSSYGADR